MTAIAKGLGSLFGMGGQRGADPAEIERQRREQETALAKQNELRGVAEAQADTNLAVMRRLPRGRRLVTSDDGGKTTVG